MRFWTRTLAWLIAMIAGFEIACRLFIGWSPHLRFDPAWVEKNFPRALENGMFGTTKDPRFSVEPLVEAGAPGQKVRLAFLVQHDMLARIHRRLRKKRARVTVDDRTRLFPSRAARR